MAEEVELKLALAERDQARLRRHPLLQRADVRQLENLDNIYYDTGELALRRRGIALRLRRSGRAWLQTVKLAGNSAGGLSSRPEWEEPYCGRFDFSSIEVPALRHWLERPELQARLVPIFETRFRRITWKFSAAAGMVLLTLDRGWIIAGDRREAISEVELELDGAPVQALFDLAATLARQVALAPSVLSKAQRGYRLHRGTALGAVEAGTVPLSGTMSCFDAFRLIAVSCLNHLQQNHPGALSSGDPRFMVQLRLATARLLSALQLFGAALPAGLDDSLRAPLSALLLQLGRTQERDRVRAEIVGPVLAGLPGEQAVSALADNMDSCRHAERATSIALLAAPDYGRTLLTLLEALQPGTPDDMPAVPVHGLAAGNLRRLGRQLRRLALAARVEHAESMDALHAGIIDLRHALDLFAPLARPNSWRRATQQLAAAHDTLGRMCTLNHAGALLLHGAGNDPQLRQAVTLIGRWHSPRYARLRRAISGQLSALAGFRLPRLDRSARRDAPAAKAKSGIRTEETKWT